MKQYADNYLGLIDLATDELREYNFITEHTKERLVRHGIDPFQVELGWADEMECMS